MHKQYRILHHCEQAVFSWEKMRMADSKKAWSPVYRGRGSCLACDTEPPVEMTGFINLLEWETT